MLKSFLDTEYYGPIDAVQTPGLYLYLAPCNNQHPKWPPMECQRPKRSNRGLGSLLFSFMLHLTRPFAETRPPATDLDSSGFRGQSSALNRCRQQHWHNYHFKMRDEMMMDEMDDERDRWLAALDEIEICSLASSFRNGDQCKIFKPREHGAFNVCFFVEFDSPRERWVVRIPIPSCVPKAMWDEKTEIELATMR